MLVLLLAAALAAPDLAAAEAAGWYSWLLEEGAYGRLQNERAAFLIREADGSLTLEPWTGGGFRHARHRGRVPERTVAVLHTHPRGERKPSARDRQEARRLGLPVVVITPDAVIAARPDGSVTTVLGSGWSAR